MNVPAMVPCAVAGDAAASGDGAKQTVGEGSRSVPGFLFPLLFSDLLQPEAAENPPVEKRTEKSFPDANPTAVVPISVLLPMPAGFILAPIAGQITDAPNRASTDADLAPEAPLELGAHKAEATDANETPDLEQTSNQVVADPDFQSAGDTGEAPLPAGFVLEAIHAELTVPSPAPVASDPAAQAILRFPAQEISEPAASGSARRQQPASQASAIPEATDAPPRTSPVQNVAVADGIFPAVPAFASERASGAPAAASLEMAGPKGMSEVAAPAAPLERAALRMEPSGKVELAFTARLAPLDKPTAPHSSAPLQGKSMGPLTEGLVPSIQPTEMDENSARRDLSVARPMIALRTATHSGAGGPPDADPPVHNTESLALANETRSAEVPASPARPPHAAQVAEPHRAAIATPPEPSPLWPATAREIRLQVSGGEQRVDVRLTEHRGEVQVAVRTPDSGLTEALRSDLPALSARLEQSGFRAETWHPAVSRPDHPLLPPQPSSSGSPQGHPGERQNNSQDHEPPPRRAPVPGDRSDSPPPEFSWLLSSLR